MDGNSFTIKNILNAIVEFVISAKSYSQLDLSARNLFTGNRQ